MNLRQGDPWENLAAAVVYQAAMDFRTAKEADRQGELCTIRHFFRSQWCRALIPNLDPEVILSRLEAE
ncbi:MAG: hypothetical protein DUD30_00780 [Lactobacillus sp.]|nr:MAG: hypothetical protein DUD30_00780 [Lactobacillus sp.]